MPDLVDTIRKEIDARLEELRPLAREASDLQSALDALNGVPAAPAARGRRRRRQSGQSAAPRRSRSAGGRHSRPCRGLRGCEPGLYRERRGKGTRAQSEFGGHAPDAAQQAGRPSQGSARLLSGIAERGPPRLQLERVLELGAVAERPELGAE